jgi:hypothetical protein
MAREVEHLPSAFDPRDTAVIQSPLVYAHYVPRIVLGTGNTIMNPTKALECEVCFLVKESDNKKVNKDTNNKI